MTLVMIRFAVFVPIRLALTIAATIRRTAGTGRDERPVLVAT
jgi:hypothetical protein